MATQKAPVDPIQEYLKVRGDAPVDLGSYLDYLEANTAPVAAPQERTAVDGLRSFGASVNNTLKTVTDLAGTNNPVSNFLADNAKTWESEYSPAYKEELQKQAAEREALGADPSYTDRALLAAKQTLRNPVEGLGEIAGNILPLALGGLAGVGTKGMVGVSAAMGAGAVKGGIAETIQNAPEASLMADPLYAKLRADGMPEAEAKAKLGEQRASYGEAYGKILTGGTLGALVGKFGSVENALANVGKAAASKGGTLKNIGVDIAKEVGTEIPQEMTETYLGNKGAAEQGAQIAPDQGVIESGTKAGIMASVGGGVAGVANAMGRAPEQLPEPTPVDNLADQLQAQVDKGDSPLSRAAQTAPELAPDEISTRVRDVETAFREGGLLDKLGEIGQGAVTRSEFLEALVTAKNKNLPENIRQMALDSLEQAMQWLADGAMPSDPSTGSPYSTELATQPAPAEPGTALATTPGSELTSPGMPQAFDPNTIDGQVTEINENQIGGPRALPAPETQETTQSALSAQLLPPGDANGQPNADAPTPGDGAGVGGDMPSASVDTGDVDGARPVRAEPSGQADATVGDLAEQRPQATAPVAPARKPVEAPQVFIPPGEGSDANLPAATRKRKAQLAAMAADGFETVEQRDGKFYFVNTRANTEMALDGMGDAARARVAVAANVERLANTAAASPNNDRLNPTDAQIAAGNYKKSDVIPLNGMKVVLENPRGSVRSGTGKNGKRWSNTMKSHYGEIVGTEAADGDRLDTFIGPRPDSSKIFVVDQLNEDGTYDESKVMQGFLTIEEARQGYLENYKKGWTGLGAITEMTPAQVMAWAKSDLAKKPAAQYAQQQTTGATNDGQNSGATGSGLDTGAPAAPGRGASNGTSGNQDAAAGTGPDGSPGAIAVEGNENAVAQNADTLSKTRDAVNRYREQLQSRLNATTDTRDRLALEQEIQGLPDAADPQGKELQDYANMAAAWAKAFGQAIGAYSDSRATATDGFQIGDQALVNLSNPNMPLQWTMAHEFKHLSEDIPGLKALYDSIFRLIPAKAKAEYFKYLHRTKQVSASTIGNASAEDMATLRQEMVADFMGQRFVDRAWLENLAKQKPNLFGEFVRDWLNILQSLITEIKAVLSRGDNAKDVDRLMRGHLKQLEEMKAIATDIATAWAERNPKLAQSTGATESIRNSARDLPPELNGITSGVTDAEIKAAGISAEDAYPPLQWKADKSGYQETAMVPQDGSPKLQRIEINEDLRNPNLWDGSMLGTWVDNSMSERDGKATKPAVKAFFKRQVAGIELRARNFDLATAVPAEQLANLVSTWKSLESIAGAKRYSDVSRGKKTLIEIAEEMGVTDQYRIKVTAMPAFDSENDRAMEVAFLDKNTGEGYAASLTLRSSGTDTYLDANTMELGKSGLGGAFYQMAAEYAAGHNLQLYPEQGISGINSYRRTEQQISAALRTGRSNAMVPHRTQRIYGFENKPMTQAKHDANLGRLLLAGMRNAREIVPGFGALRYHPETDQFTNASGKSMEAAVKVLLASPDSRAFGMGRSTLARSVMTNMILKGELKDVTSFAKPVLYSARDTAAQEYREVEAKYKGTPEWMKTPTGGPTSLTERQWVQVRTPSFLNWFGDWTKGDIWNRDDVSKAVGSDGEPEVVYHGTDKGGFYKFRQPGGRNRGDLGIFTTSNYSMAKSYVRKGRPQDMAPMSDADKLDELGIEITEYQGRVSSKDTEDQTLYSYETPYGDEVSGFATKDAAARDAIAEFWDDADETKAGIYGVFLNIRNPYEADFAGAIWSGERPDQFQVRNQEGEVAYTPLGEQFFDSEYDAKAFAFEIAGEVEPAEDHYETTDDAAREGRRSGHDGTIIRAVRDDGGGYGYDGAPSDVFVAIKPEQIKSADFNTGEFGDSDDIRYSAQDRNFKLDLEKDERAVAKFAGLSPEEKDAIAAAAKDLGLTATKTAELQATARAMKKRFPTAAGWAPVEVIGLQVKKDAEGNPRPGTESPKFKSIPYSFNVPPGAKRAPQQMDEAWMTKVTKQFGSLIDDLYERADKGDKNAQTIIAHQTWYRNVAEILRREYGAQGDLLADLLGATSPNTPVDTNWRFSVEIMRRFTRGEFRPLMEKFVAYLDHGGAPSKFPAASKIRQISGKLYGMNSGNAMVAMADLWRNIEPGSAPKARNFALNLIGQSEMATIDVWAARMLRRSADMVRGANLPRIPPVAEEGVSGVWNADVSGVTGAFGFGAEVMRRVAEEQQAKGRDITAPDLQAIAWFAEKELWGQNGWTTKMGEGGSFEENLAASPVERYLAGFSIQQGQKVPEAGDVSTAQARVLAMLTGDDSVVAARAHPTRGLYGGVVEHSFDAEWTVARGQHNPALVMAEIAQLSKENGQLDMFVSRVVAPEENNPNARPGVEIYFKNKQSFEQALPVLEAFIARGQDGFTLATDIRSKPGADEYIGVRLQYVPEISMRFDKASRKKLLAPGGIEKALQEKAEQLDDIVRDVRLMDGVAYAATHKYDTVVVGKENYDEYIDRGAARQNSQAGREAWFGRPVRAGLEAAVGRYEGKRGQDDAGRVSAAGSAPRSSARDGGGREELRGLQAGENAASESGVRTPAQRGGQEDKLTPLPGAPNVPGFHGPDPRLVEVAEKYAADNGITLKRQAEYVEVDPERAKRIADAYAAMPHAPQDTKVLAAYENLIKQTTQQYQALVNAGYKFWFIDLNQPSNAEYASSPWNAMRDMRANQQMGVFPTADGFGSGDGGEILGNPLESDTGIRWPVGGVNGPLKQVLANDLFRAVHDAFGHGLEGAGFRAQGEENAWQAHSRLFTGSALGAITSETRGQNSWLNYGPHGDTNRTAKVEDTVFADQKTGLMPEWTWMEGLAGDMKYSARDLGFYSELSNQIQKASMNQAPAGAWKSFIGALNQKGVKADEVEWTGINDWLDLQTGKVPKQALVDYLDANGVQVEEVALGNGTLTEEEAQELRELLDLYRRSEEGEEGAFDAGDFDRLQELEQNGEAKDLTRYGRYTLPGGENYREVLLTLPDAKPTVAKYAALKGITESEAIADRTGLKAWQAANKVEQYKSSHWDAPNVLAHIRLNDRTDADGKSVLFVEEVQSDWAQDGRKNGFNGDPDGWMVMVDGEAWHTFDNKSDAVKKASTIDGATVAPLALSGAELKTPTAPFVQKTDGWLNLALKRIMRLAVDGGYDKVAFVNGEQSADRYSLAKQIDSMIVGKEDDGSYSLVASQGNREVVKRDNVPEGELEGLVGKEMAQRIIDGGGKNIGRNEREFTGIDLKVGGDGMKAFYDKIVPSALSAQLKKLDGGKLQSVSIKQTDGFAGNARKAPAQSIISDQPGFTITDAMREKVGAGMPLFSKRDQTETPEFKRWADGLTVHESYDEAGSARGVFKLYHLTTADFSEFKPGGLNPKDSGPAIWLTPDPADTASAFRVGSSSSGYRDGARTMPVFAKLRSPLLLDDLPTLQWARDVYANSEFPQLISQKTIDDLRADGYDSIVFKGREIWKGGSDEIIVFSPKQIKSAIGNRGTFDDSNPDILFSVRDKSELKEKQAEAKSAKYAGKQVVVPVKIEDTGEIGSLTMDVSRTIDDYDNRTANLQKLLACL